MIGAMLFVRYPTHLTAGVNRGQAIAGQQLERSVDEAVGGGNVAFAVEYVVDGDPVVVECGGGSDVRIRRAETELVAQRSGAERHTDQLFVVGQLLHHIRVVTVE